jgi:hypothetical protein
MGGGKEKFLVNPKTIIEIWEDFRTLSMASLSPNVWPNVVARKASGVTVISKNGL